MADAPQVAYSNLPHTGEVHQVHRQGQSMQGDYPYFNNTSGPAHQPLTILGFRRRNFYIIATIVLILVGVTIAGSVGGSLAVQNSK